MLLDLRFLYENTGTPSSSPFKLPPGITGFSVRGVPVALFSTRTFSDDSFDKKFAAGTTFVEKEAPGTTYTKKDPPG